MCVYGFFFHVVIFIIKHKFFASACYNVMTYSGSGPNPHPKIFYCYYGTAREELNHITIYCNGSIVWLKTNTRCLVISTQVNNTESEKYTHKYFHIPVLCINVAWRCVCSITERRFFPFSLAFCFLSS